MFKELAPYLRQRAVLFTVTHLENEQIRVNIVPQKLKDGENVALTVSGTAEELDRDLPETVISFVAAHLELKNTLDRAKAEMDAAAKAAQSEARSKSKALTTKAGPKPEPAKAPESAGPVTKLPLEPPRAAGLFDLPEPAAGADTEKEEKIPNDDNDESGEEEEDTDEAA